MRKLEGTIMRRTSGRAAAALIAGLLAVACGSDGSQRDSEAVVIENPLAAAAVATTDAKSARFEMTMTMSSGAFPDEVTMNASGAIEFATQDAHMTMDISEFFAGLLDDPADAVVEMRIVSGVYYLRFPAALGGPSGWLAADAEDLTSGALSNEVVGQLSNTDPTLYLKYLAALTGDVETLGTEEVRGVTTTHYAAVIDSAARSIDEAVLAELGIDAAALRATFAPLRSLGVDDIPVEVWIGDDGLVRRQRISIDFDDGAVQLGMRMGIEMFDYGVEVDVEAPPADEVTDFAGALTGAG